MGITFIEINNVTIPLSVAGVQVDISINKFVSNSLQFSKEDRIIYGDKRNNECLSFEVTPKDIRDLVQAHSFTRTLLENIQSILLPWLSVSYSGSTKFGVNDLRVDVAKGSEVNQGECKGAPLHKNKLYSVFKLGTGFDISLYGNKFSLPGYLGDGQYCIIMDICQEVGTSVFLILPEESRDTFDNITLFKSMAQQYGMQIHSAALGLSATKQINVETGDIEVWRGQETFYKYS